MIQLCQQNCVLQASAGQVPPHPPMGVAVLWTAALTLLIRGADPIPSACGVRQGDPMGSFLFFCFATQPFLEEASTQVQSLTYVDDIYLVGAPEKMPGVISSLQQQNLDSVNLKLNTTSPGPQGNA